MNIGEHVKNLELGIQELKKIQNKKPEEFTEEEKYQIYGMLVGLEELFFQTGISEKNYLKFIEHSKHFTLNLKWLIIKSEALLPYVKIFIEEHGSKIY